MTSLNTKFDRARDWIGIATVGTTAVWAGAEIVGGDHKAITKVGLYLLVWVCALSLSALFDLMFKVELPKTLIFQPSMSRQSDLSRDIWRETQEALRK